MNQDGAQKTFDVLRNVEPGPIIERVSDAGRDYELRDERANWCLVDPARHHLADDAPTSGLVLVKIPPPVPRGGVGQLQLRLDGIALADLDLAVCEPCQRAVLENVRVDAQHRRRGYGRVLVTAALTLGLPLVDHIGER